MSGLSRGLRFAGQVISKERYAKGVKSGTFAYHPKTIRRLELLSFTHSVVYLGLLVCAFALNKPQPETFVFGYAEVHPG